jgi:transcriptional regulator with XRE-family HTH domain
MAEKDPKMVRLGERIRELREGAGLSRDQMAEAAGVSVRAVVQWELGEREPGWFNMLALAGALGVDCTAFTQAPAEREPAGPGRPRKKQGVQLDLRATESAPLASVPGPTPTKKGRAGKLPEAQDKPKERTARRPRGG